MARLYCDEQFPREVSEQLRTMGHDVLTVQTAGNANLGIPDEAVLFMKQSAQKYPCLENSFVLSAPLQGSILKRAARPQQLGYPMSLN